MSSGESAGGAATRRGFVGGLVAAGVGQTLAAGPARAAEAKTPPCTPKAPGVRTFGLAVAHGRHTVWTTDNASTTITAHTGRKLERGRSIDVKGAPLHITTTRDGRYALVTTASYDRPGLSVVDLRTRKVARFDVGPEPGTVMERHHVVWVAGGGAKGTLTSVDLDTGHVGAPIAVGAHPRGLALDRYGKHALVALNGQSAVAHVDLVTGRVRLVPTKPFPYGVALSPDGKQALVTHNGFGDHKLTPVDLVHHRAHSRVSVGDEPLGVAYTRSGRHALVALRDAHAVAVVDGRTGKTRRRIRELGAPRAVVVAGHHAYVADGTTGTVKRLRLGAHA